jgi:hypothetical protein
MEMNGQPLFICNLLPKKYTIVQLDVLSKKRTDQRNKSIALSLTSLLHKIAGCI